MCPNRSNSPIGHTIIRTVNIDAICPTYVAARGAVTPYRFGDDGDHADRLSCDRWENPCGHAGNYGDVLVEAPRAALPQ